GKKGSDERGEQGTNDPANSPMSDEENDSPHEVNDEVDQLQAHAVDDVGKTGEATVEDGEDEGMSRDVHSANDTDDLEEKDGVVEVEVVADDTLEANDGAEDDEEGEVKSDEVTPEEVILSAEDRLNSEIEE